MKKATLLAIYVFAFALANAQSKQQIVANQTAFARLYGYVKYFYPGDEAAAINWDNFAIYGAKTVASCKNKEELKQALRLLFDPIVPTLQLADSADNIVFNKQSVVPQSLNGLKTIAWQHVGGQTRPLSFLEEPFKSARTNRPIHLDGIDQNIGVFPKILDATAYQNKEFRLRGRAKIANGSGGGHFLALVLTPGDKWGFFDNMVDNPIITTEWKNFEIAGKIDANAQFLRVGLFLNGAGEFWVDDMSVDVMENGNWKNIYTNNFNNENTGIATREILRGTHNVADAKIDNKVTIIEDVKAPAEKWLSVKSLKNAVRKTHTTFFKDYPKVGEYISKNIGGGLKVIMPIALYGTDENTYPQADAAKFAELKSKLNTVSAQINNADSLATRFADLTITWNIFQHFFPYLDIAKTNWQRDLSYAFDDAFDDKDGYDFLKTLKKFTAPLKDQHIRVYWYKDQNAFYPPITWEWVENKLVVTRVLDKTLPLTKGDIITGIYNQNPAAYFKDVKQYISAATPGGLTDQAQTEALKGPKETPLQLSYLNRDNVAGQVSLPRQLTHQDHLNALSLADSVKQIDKDIMYLNIGTVSGKTIDKLLPQLKKSKAIICDLRNWKDDNWTTNHFMEYLLTKKDTATHWGQTAHIIYPDQEHLSGYFTEGFDLVPAKPHLNAKIIFLADATDYSWAETYMGIIAHYKLATIVGQPTAGTNGDVNSFSLPGGYRIMFSGLKITQLDLSQHQGVGTKPDVYVEKTIKGIREGKDEVLDKAIEIARATP